ncbi:hypothetical protein ACFL6I_12120 [candidate division KSB1 bacterium]
MVGNTIIIIILFAIGFQVIILQTKQDKRHKEIRDILKGIENKLENDKDSQ